MGLFGKSFEDQVKEVLSTLDSKIPGVKNLSASIEGKVVTLKGNAATKEARSEVMRQFTALVKADNTVNQIAIDAPAPAAAPVAAAVPAARIHEVASGDTLSGIAKKYYGNAGLYMKIFEANKDQLKDPNVIKVGQKLKIPE
jgi:LysM repeat protein